MSLKKLVLRFLSRPIHLHIALPLGQTVWIKLSTGLSYYADEGYESPINLTNRGLGALLGTDGLRYVSVTIGAVVLGLEFGTFKRCIDGS